MKKYSLSFAAFLLAATLWSCSDSGNNAGTTDASGNSNTGGNDTSNSANANTSSVNSTSGTGTESTAGGAGATPGASANAMPLTGQDSTFVMKAAMGGMMEVQAGQLAQQKAAHDRVKNFAAMMVADHQKANQELMSMVSNRGITIPQTLPADMQRHMDQMQKMQGRAFDKHYMSMMVSDHQKTVADFQRQANSGKDEALKAWAAKMLPALQMHRDSAVAINKLK